MLFLVALIHYVITVCSSLRSPLHATLEVNYPPSPLLSHRPTPNTSVPENKVQMHAKAKLQVKIERQQQQNHQPGVDVKFEEGVDVLLPVNKRPKVNHTVRTANTGHISVVKSEVGLKTEGRVSVDSRSGSTGIAGYIAIITFTLAPILIFDFISTYRPF